jgi:hypothetical protein
VLFIDESGDHSLAVIDPQYPIFVLGGVIVDSDYAAGELTECDRDLNSHSGAGQDRLPKGASA